MRRQEIILLVALWASVGAPAALQGQSIRLMCASSLRESIEPLVDQFSRQHNIKMQVLYGSSSLLRNQLQAGATTDVFIFAGEAQARWLTDHRMAERYEPIGNTRLVLLVRPGVHLKTLRDLAKPGLRLALADPGVPIGRFTEGMLRAAVAKNYLSAREYEALYRNIVTRDFSAQNLKNKIQLREADAAFIYLSQWDSGDVIELPTDINPSIPYVAGVTLSSEQTYWGHRWVAFLQSPEAKRRFSERGIQ